jgi:O-antigen/teichoic acid export membrane protein
MSLIRIPESRGLKRYAINTAWMLSEKLLSLGLGLVATVLLARSLGPADFGFFNYALSLVALMGVFCHLGLSGLAVKEFKEAPERTSEVLTTVFAMKLIMASLGFVTLAVIACQTANSPEHIFAIMIIGLTLFAKPFETLDHWFQAHVLAKFGAVSHFAGQGIGSTLKILVAISGLPLVYAAGAHATMLAITAVLLTVFYVAKNRHQLTPTFSSSTAKELLQKGAWVFIGSMTAVVYLKIDQVMLQHMVGAEAVGLYAAAARLSEAWYFLPVTIMASLFPKLLEKKKHATTSYNHFLQTLFDGLFVMAAAVSLLVILFSDQIINLLYGPEYAISATILRIHIMASVFIFMRALFSKWILAEELYKLSLITQGLGAISNIVLNYFLIQRMGGVGAAWATLLSYSIASYFALMLHPRSRVLFMMMTKSLCFHWVITAKNIYKHRSLRHNAH